jgi:hypothetical protein
VDPYLQRERDRELREEGAAAERARLAESARIGLERKQRRFSLWQIVAGAVAATVATVGGLLAIVLSLRDAASMS